MLCNGVPKQAGNRTSKSKTCKSFFAICFFWLGSFSKLSSHSLFCFLIMRHFDDAVLRPLACCAQGSCPPLCLPLDTPLSRREPAKQHPERLEQRATYELPVPAERHSSGRASNSCYYNMFNYRIQLNIRVQQVCVQPPTSALNVTLPAFAVERRDFCRRAVQQSIDISYRGAPSSKPAARRCCCRILCAQRQ